MCVVNIIICEVQRFRQLYYPLTGHKAGVVSGVGLNE